MDIYIYISELGSLVVFEDLSFCEINLFFVLIKHRNVSS